MSLLLPVRALAAVLGEDPLVYDFDFPNPGLDLLEDLIRSFGARAKPQLRRDLIRE